MRYAGINYIISGAGALTSTIDTTSSIADKLWSAVGVPSVAICKIEQYDLTVTFYNLDGDALYSFTKSKSSPTLNPTSAPTAAPEEE